jgi:hypothetical protein
MGEVIVRHGVASAGGRAFAYRLHRVPQRKHVHLLVDEDGTLQVRVPYRYPQAALAGLIRENAAWIGRALAAASERKRNRPNLETGTVLPFGDERLRLEVHPVQEDLFGPRVFQAGWVRRWRATLEVHPSGEETEDVRGLLEGWYRGEAKRHLPRRLRDWGRRLALLPRSVTIRGQKSRWGSCSQRGGISLNWRLMLLPEELTDYVLVHELCHLRHLDHSERFWALVRTWVPDYRAKEARLKAVHHHELAL